jgi:hypothetical protein
MKLKSFLLFATVALTLAFLPAASAQVGGNDWTATDGKTWNQTWKDGTKHSFSILYSPSTLVRNGDVVSVTIDTVYKDSTPISFFKIQVNCRTHQHTFASYDTSTNPATLGPASAWVDNEPNTSAPAVEAIICK